MEKLNPQFKKLLQSHPDAQVRNHSGVVYGAWADFRLAYLNPGWFRFAEDNRGEPQISTQWALGSPMLDCMAQDLRDLYNARLVDCLESRSVWSHEYECSSALLYRRFHQLVYPFENGEGLLFVNSLIVEIPHEPGRESTSSQYNSDYIDSNGFICQCAYCRRVKNHTEPDRWDWKPDWVTRIPEGTSHTFCTTCMAHYYGRYFKA